MEHKHEEHQHGGHIHCQHHHGPCKHQHPHGHGFDSMANKYDERPDAIQLSNKAIEAIKPLLHKDANVLDLGAGTGLITMAMQPLVKHIVALDSSQSMLNVMINKISQHKITNITPVLCDVTGDVSIGGPYTHIVSSVVLHHIGDIPRLLHKLHDSLTDGGVLAVVDYYNDEVKMPATGGHLHHRGFNKDELTAWLTAAGYKDIQYKTLAQSNWPAFDSMFDVFIVVAVKA